MMWLICQQSGTSSSRERYLLLVEQDVWRALDKREILWYTIFVTNKGGIMMEKFVPYEKLSRKKQKEWNARQRRSWGDVNPVTRKSTNPAAYDRNAEKRKARKWSDDSSPVSFLCRLFMPLCCYINKVTIFHRRAVTAVAAVRPVCTVSFTAVCLKTS